MTRIGASHSAGMLRASFATEQAVYGVLLVSGMIVVAGTDRSTSWQVFVTVAATVLIFWAAHVYAGTVARHGFEGERLRPLQESLRESVQASWGLLASALLPCAILLLGTTAVVPDLVAVWSALCVGILVLAVLGYIAFARRGAPWPVCLLGAAVTAAFGGLLALLKALVH